MHCYWNSPGGRKDREAEADRIRTEEAAKEAMEEERIRRDRAEKKRAASAGSMSSGPGK